jgi:xanthine dehydrogenase accessory factor
MQWGNISAYSLGAVMDIYEEVVRMRQEGRRGALATIVSVSGSVPSVATAKMLVRDDGSTLGTVGGGCVEAEVCSTARRVIEQQKPRTLRFDLSQKPEDDTGLICGGTLEVFIEPLAPAPMLYLFGAGHVSLSIYQIARMAGFETVVVDDRESYANRDRFPDARKILVGDMVEIAAQQKVSDTAFIVIVTRGHRDDLRVLRWAIDTPAQYIGMIGSRRKVMELYRVLQNEGVAAEKLTRVYAPIGLSIGAIFPEEIGIAIVAELIAIWRHAKAEVSHLRYSPQPRSQEET